MCYQDMKPYQLKYYFHILDLWNPTKSVGICSLSYYTENVLSVKWPLGVLGGCSDWGSPGDRMKHVIQESPC